jgi:hypothetical protein
MCTEKPDFVNIIIAYSVEGFRKLLISLLEFGKTIYILRIAVNIKLGTTEGKN